MQSQLGAVLFQFHLGFKYTVENCDWIRECRRRLLSSFTNMVSYCFSRFLFLSFGKLYVVLVAIWNYRSYAGQINVVELYFIWLQVVEFRDRTWISAENLNATLDLCKQLGLTLCCSDELKGIVCHLRFCSINCILPLLS